MTKTISFCANCRKLCYFFTKIFEKTVNLSPDCKVCNNIYFVLASLTVFLVLYVSVAGLWATSDKASDSKSKRKSVRFA